MTDARIEEAIRALAHARGRGKTLCPSEVARTLSPEWRALMADVRRVARGMEGIRISQGGAEIDPMQARGPVRLGLR